MRIPLGGRIGNLKLAVTTGRAVRNSPLQEKKLIKISRLINKTYTNDIVESTMGSMPVVNILSPFEMLVMNEEDEDKDCHSLASSSLPLPLPSPFLSAPHTCGRDDFYFRVSVGSAIRERRMRERMENVSS